MWEVILWMCVRAKYKELELKKGCSYKFCFPVRNQIQQVWGLGLRGGASEWGERDSFSGRFLG